MPKPNPDVLPKTYKQQAIFRKVLQHNCCSNCEFITHTMEQGVAGCKIVLDAQTSIPDWMVCNRWMAKYVPSEKEKILEKLTDHERKVLGL